MASRPYYEQGLHVGDILSQALTESQTGTPQFVLRVKVLGTPTEDGQYVPHIQQYERSIFMALTEGTMPFVSETLIHLGFTGTTLAALDPGHPRCHSFVKQQVQLWCKHDTYQGEMRERWSISRPREIITTPVDPKKLRNLDSLYGMALKDGPKRPEAQPKPEAGKTDYGLGAPVATDGTFITDDDIPF